MQIDETLLTDKEIQIVKKLKEEMFFAISYEHLAFYKNEINAIMNQASRRNSFLMKTNKSLREPSCL
ncbi:hypothetical protein RFW18_04830 [Metabacillus idriensis]|uniref:hypothetical protein n=1 Tax=Metabacillus idriensis TaxID=324768 RepID=UPI0028147F3F|nr:hypothetical protein [Metabacillus idriensis]MDR0137061.1 hypothetical protein [Metabacillus idriensis]